MQFNVLTDFQFPVVMTDGTIGKVNPVQALRQAHQIREIATSSPLDRFAIFRFLLALLYWCQGFPHSSGQPDNGQPFQEDWFARLDEDPKGFDLLGDGPRFYQFLPTGGKKTTPGYLIHELPTGTNQNHFRHTRDGDYGLCLNCCTLGLLRLPPFAIMGGAGYRPGINGSPPLFAYPEGDTLAATLRLSWRHTQPIGEALWDNRAGALPNSGDVGALCGLTWVPHAYWLLDDGRAAQCLLCKSVDAITHAHRSNARPKLGENVAWLDPHIISRPDAADGEFARINPTNPLQGNARPDRWVQEVLGATKSFNRRYRIVSLTTDQAKCIHAYEYRGHVSRDASLPDDYLEQREKKTRQYKTILSKAFRGDRAASKDSNPAAFAIRDVRRAIEPRLRDDHIVAGSWPEREYRRGRSLLRQAAQSLAGPRQLDVQSIYSDAGASGTRSEYERVRHDQAQEFIDRVAAQLQHGELSRARRWAGSGMHQDSEAFDIFTALWWQIGDSHSRNRRINRDAAWLAVKLLARFPRLHANSAVRDADMAASAPIRLAQLLGRHHDYIGERQRSSFRNRFQRLLSTPFQQAEHALLPLVLTLSGGNNARAVIDWGALIQDLGAWGTPRTQRRWAHDFVNHSPDKGD